MGLPYKITTTVTTASTTGYQRLFHGTLAGNVGSIVSCGIDHDKLKELGGGDFWATIDLENARSFADVAEQQLMFKGGLPGQAIFSFELSMAMLDRLEGQQWLWKYSHGYQFIPACYSVLNKEMKNIEITFEE